MLKKSRIIFALSLFFLSIFSISDAYAATTRPTSCYTPNGTLALGSSTCFSNVLFKCSTAGYLSYSSCPYGCSNNACNIKPASSGSSIKPTNCSTPNGKLPVGSSTCFSNVLFRCSSTASLTYTNCTYGCSGNVCRAKSDPRPTYCSAPSGTLALNTAFCFENTLYKCANDGSLFVTKCAYGCTGSYCNATKPSPTPIPTTSTQHTVYCSAPGGYLAANNSRCFASTIFRCSSSGILSYSSCSGGCSGNYCSYQPAPTYAPSRCSYPGGSLSLNSYSCYSGSIFRCSSYGSLSVTNCPYGCSGSYCRPAPTYAPSRCSYPGGSLSTNSSTCYSNTIYRCSSSGSLSSTHCSYGCYSSSSCRTSSY